MTAIAARVKYLVAAHGRPVALALLVCAIALAGVGVSSPVPTERVTVVTSESPVGVVQNTSVTVTGDTPAYARGTTLRDEPLYLRSAAPDLRVAETVTAPAGTTATVRVDLVYRARTEESGVFWTSTNRSRAAQVAFDEDARAHTVELPVNATAVGAHRDALQRSFGVRVLVEPVVRVTVDYALPGGEEGTLEQATAMTFSRRTYSLPTAGTVDENPRTETVVRPDPDRAVALGGLHLGRGTVASALGLLGCLAGAVGAIVGGNRWDETRLRETVTRQRFDDWITTVTDGTPDVPADARRTETLRGLVDAAIDRGGRVEYWPDRGVYVAELDGQTYVHEQADRPLAVDTTSGVDAAEDDADSPPSADD